MKTLRLYGPALIMALAACLLTSCGGGSRVAVIKGSYKNIKSGEFYLYSDDVAWATFDTLHLQDGAFRYERELADTLVLTVQYPNFLQTRIIVAPGATITIDGDAANLSTASIGGLPDNKLLTEFRLKALEMTAAEARDAAEAFIRANPGTWAAEAVLRQYFLDVEAPDWKKALSLAELMHKAAPNHRWLSSRMPFLHHVVRTLSGQPLPAFSAVSLSGDTVTQATFEGRPLLVWFWASWQGESGIPLNRFRRLLKGNQKKTSQMSVCLDTDTTECQRIVKRDSLGGINVCDQMGWHSPLVECFAIDELPMGFVVGPDGKIVARSASSDTIAAKMEEQIRKIFAK